MEWWRNFWYHQFEKNRCSPYEQLCEGVIGEQYGFIFNNSLQTGEGFILEFEEPEDALAFVLKWS